MTISITVGSKGELIVSCDCCREKQVYEPSKNSETPTVPEPLSKHFVSRIGDPQKSSTDEISPKIIIKNGMAITLEPVIPISTTLHGYDLNIGELFSLQKGLDEVANDFSTKLNASGIAKRLPENFEFAISIPGIGSKVKF